MATNQKIVWQGKHFRAYHETIEEAIGEKKAKIFEFVWRLDGTRTIAINDKNQMLITREYRHELGGFDWRLPGGKLDFEGEDVASAAARELLEETGVSAQKWKYLGATSPDATVRFRRHFLCATGLTVADQKLSDGEIISVHWKDIEDARSMALGGEIREEISALFILRFIHAAIGSKSVIS